MRPLHWFCWTKGRIFSRSLERRCGNVNWSTQWLCKDRQEVRKILSVKSRAHDWEGRDCYCLREWQTVWQLVQESEECSSSTEYWKVTWLKGIQCPTSTMAGYGSTTATFRAGCRTTALGKQWKLPTNQRLLNRLVKWNACYSHKSTQRSLAQSAFYDWNCCTWLSWLCWLPRDILRNQIFSSGDELLDRLSFQKIVQCTRAGQLPQAQLNS